MSWDQYQRRPHITFRTPAPADAPPEVKGYRAYFQPEVLEWSVRADDVRVMASGPTTRSTQLGRGEMWWSVEGRRGDDRPEWLTLPTDLLARAKVAVEALDAFITEAWAGVES